MALVASTRPSGRVEPLTNPASQWASRISEWSVPGRFAFFVFKINSRGDVSEWFPGLQTQWVGDPFEQCDLFVGGTVAQWDSACYASLNRDHPHDCCVIYRTIHTMLSDFGFDMRGKRTSQAKKYYLQ